MPHGRERAEQLADFAHAVLSVARDIRIAMRDEAGIVEMTQLESLVMNHVERNPGISPSRISTEVGLRSSNASALLRALERKGMIQRVPDPTDRRSVSVQATPLAARNLARVRAEWAALLAEHVAPAVDLAPAIDLLTKIDESIAPSGRPGAAPTAE